MVKIAIIGAGPAGIITARLCLEDGHEITVFEQEPAPGGVWLYSPTTNRHSTMYERLVTNVPKQIMAFPGIPFGDHLPCFLSREHVLEYMQKLAQNLPIRFNTRVLKVKDVEGQWAVEAERNIFAVKTTELFDVVFVCNGHHHSPRKTLDVRQFKGQYLHSRDYRTPQKFQRKRVAVIGAGFSGVDIALQLAEYAEKVFLVGDHATYAAVPEPIVQIPSKVAKVGESWILLKKGEQIGDIDTIVECKGFQWSYPFLDQQLICPKFGGRMVSPLWLHFAHRHFPRRLFFIGLNDMTMLLRTMTLQARCALKLIKGTVRVPPVEQMEKWEADRLRILECSQRAPEFFHVNDPEQFDYIRELCHLGGLERFEDEEVIRKLDEQIRPMRRADPGNYKKCEFVWDGEQFRHHAHKSKL